MKAVYCPYCGGRTKRNGRTSSGSQRWRCTACGASTTVRYDDTATRLDEFLGWLLSKDSRAAMPGGGRSFRRRTAEFWEVSLVPRRLRGGRPQVARLHRRVPGLRLPPEDGQGQDPPRHRGRRRRRKGRQVREVLHRRAARDALGRRARPRQAAQGARRPVVGGPAGTRRARLRAARRRGGEAAVPGHVGPRGQPEPHSHHQHRVQQVGHGVRRRQDGRGRRGQARLHGQAGGVQRRQLQDGERADAREG